MLRPWSIRSDSNFEMEIREATTHAKRIILVLSRNYINTFITQDTFTNIFKQKVTAEVDKLLLIRIQECGDEFRKLLDSINYIDLSEEDEITAGAILLAAVHDKGIELTIQPAFPGYTVNKAPTFPGKGHVPLSPLASTNNARTSSAPAKSQFESSPSPQISPTKTLKVFLSYSHYDKAMRVKLEIFLSTLKRVYSFITWNDGEIGAGKEWAKEINTHLSQANVVLLLVSPNFLHSDYCYNIEMEQALERHRKGEACVVPIILRPAHWEVTPLRELQALPTGGRPITRWANRDAAFLDVVKGIQEVVDRLTGNNASV